MKLYIGHHGWFGGLLTIEGFDNIFLIRPINGDFEYTEVEEEEDHLL